MALKISKHTDSLIKLGSRVLYNLQVELNTRAETKSPGPPLSNCALRSFSFCAMFVLK